MAWVRENSLLINIKHLEEFDMIEQDGFDINLLKDDKVAMQINCASIKDSIRVFFEISGNLNKVIEVK